MWRYKSRELLNTWIDYFKVYLKDYERGKTRLRKKGLSLNSTIWEIDKDTIIEFQPNLIKDFGFCYVIKDKDTQTNLAFLCLSKGEGKGFIVRNSFYEVTGQGLELRGGAKYFINLLFFLWFEIEKFTRVDVYFDLIVDVNYIHNTILIDRLKGKSKTVFEEGGKTETLYIGKKKKTENTYQLLRVYNKKLDNKKKGKEWLYSQYKTKSEKGEEIEYKDIKNITRFEIEIRRDKAKFWTVDKLLSTDFIFSVIVKTWFPFNYQFFKFLHEEDFKRIIDNKSVYNDRLQSIARKKKWFDTYGTDYFDDKDKRKTEKIFVAYWKRLFKNWISLEKMCEMLKNSINFDDKMENKVQI